MRQDSGHLDGQQDGQRPAIGPPTAGKGGAGARNEVPRSVGAEMHAIQQQLLSKQQRKRSGDINAEVILQPNMQNSEQSLS